jgi:hypothetical protein
MVSPMTKRFFVRMAVVYHRPPPWSARCESMQNVASSAAFSITKVCASVKAFLLLHFCSEDAKP